MSKGCKPRPMRVSRVEYERNWDRAFNPKRKKKLLSKWGMDMGEAGMHFCREVARILKDQQ